MNVERLLSVSKKLIEIIEQDEIIEAINTVESNLQNQISQPNNANYQSTTAESISQLKSKVDRSGYYNLNPGWLEIIEETGYSYLFGKDLAKKVNDILVNSNLTPASVKSEFEELRTELNELNSTLSELISSLEYLGFDENTLDPGQGEVGYLIPRNLVNNELGALKKEISELEFILNHISEAATGERQSIHVKTISSSEFLIYVLLGLNVISILSTGLEKILDIYKKILEIKSLRQQLSDKGVAKSKTKGVETHVNSLMRDEIKSIVKEAMSESPITDKQRKNEVSNGLEIAFNKLANRIDKGVKVEIRIEPLPEPESSEDEEGNLIEEELSKEEIDKRNLIILLRESSKKIKNFDSGGESILKLPEDSK